MAQRVDGETLRGVWRNVPSPVTVVTASGADGPLGITIGSFASTSLRPPLIAFNVSLDAQIYEPLTTGTHFAVHVVRREQAHIADRFATPDLQSEAQFEGVAYRLDPEGTPIILETLAVMTCRREAVHPAGDHSIIVGRVEGVETGEEGEPLVYFDRSYRRVGEEMQPTWFEPVGDASEQTGGS